MFRSFKTADLGDIKTMFPEVFIFLQEKNIQGMYCTQKYGEYQLTMESTGVVGQDQPSGDASHMTTLTRWKKEFRRRLTCIVVQHHKVRGWVGEIVTEKKQKKIEERAPLPVSKITLSSPCSLPSFLLLILSYLSDNALLQW